MHINRFIEKDLNQHIDFEILAGNCVRLCQTGDLTDKGGNI